ncbi:hypothetical protein HS088_TW14G01084 [Tripterygium wilfordii]|uniref:Transmembrane protein n=1 Tax=Tripterygium wilfordii TaxID=458696 RepID=A0A7J7CSI4_TRIWF|nr:hypothetical protein HS088_TW14G01084 [Tripterygium wilfordii]
MGSGCCESGGGGDPDLKGFLMAIIIALVILVVCIPPPSRKSAPPLCLFPKKQKGDQDFLMGTVCCETDDGGDSDLKGLFMAMIIALVLLILCIPSKRPRKCYVIYRCQ